MLRELARQLGRAQHQFTRTTAGWCDCAARPGCMAGAAAPRRARLLPRTAYHQILQNKAHSSDLVKYLRRQKRRRKRCGSSQERPVIVKVRVRVGDWAGDALLGRDHLGPLVFSALTGSCARAGCTFWIDSFLTRAPKTSLNILGRLFA